MPDIFSNNGWYLWNDEQSFRDMNSAPKNGIVILLNHDGIYPCLGWFDSDKGVWQEVWKHEWSFPYQPNGWMPLPKPKI